MSKQGKGARARSKQRRAAQRRARKQSRQAQYAEWRDKGINKKSKRFVKGKRRGPRARRHNVRCGNVACQRCYGVNFNPFLSKAGEPVNMPNWMYKMYKQWRALNPLYKNVPSTIDVLF